MAPSPQHALLYPFLELAGAVAAALCRSHRDQQADHEQRATFRRPETRC
ncbi:hypothetical protein [Xylella fastidiosa]|nr:hypothetical protein [Xylella fastidiosa]